MTSLTYALFKYRQQLRQGSAKHAAVMRLNCAKLTLTDELIKKTTRNAAKCTLEEMLAVNREIHFVHKLKQQIKQMHRSKTTKSKKTQQQMQLIRSLAKNRTSLTLKIWNTLVLCLKKTGFL